MKVLFICTHNRCRSIMAEAIGRQLGKTVLDVRSAGSTPEGAVNANALHYLDQRGYQTGNLRSQSWDEFADFNPDLVITLCDQAAGESCPLWMGKTEKRHWGMNDPSKIEGSENEIAAAFAAAIEELEARISGLIDAVTAAEQSPG